MADIHDQFDTILILDFGSQVRYLTHLTSHGLHSTKSNSTAILSPGDAVNSTFTRS